MLSLIRQNKVKSFVVGAIATTGTLMYITDRNTKYFNERDETLRYQLIPTIKILERRKEIEKECDTILRTTNRNDLPDSLKQINYYEFEVARMKDIKDKKIYQLYHQYMCEECGQRQTWYVPEEYQRILDEGYFSGSSPEGFIGDKLESKINDATEHLYKISKRTGEIDNRVNNHNCIADLLKPKDRCCIY